MNTDHVVAHDGTRHPFGFECLHCGAVLGLTLPVSVDEFASAGKAFVAKHRDCKAAPAAATLHCDGCRRMVPAASLEVERPGFALLCVECRDLKPAAESAS